jgi:hemerythrin
MLIARQEELITGNEELDNLHYEVFRKVNDLLLAAKAGRGNEELGRFFWFLKRYTRKHFQTEEKYQRESGFPGYALHKAQHDSFLQEVRLLEARYARDGGNTVLYVSIIRFMGDWLRNHINLMDVAAASYFRKVAQKRY